MASVDQSNSICYNFVIENYRDQTYLKLISFHNMVFLEDLLLTHVFLHDFFGTMILPIIIILIVGFAGVIIAVMKMRKPKPAQESDELKDYEYKYLARQGIESTRRKPAETRESESNFCDNCGKSLRPTAKFCSGCGTQRS